MSLKIVKSILALIFIFSSVTAAKSATASITISPPYSVEQLREWHKTMRPWPWPGQPEQKVNLRNKKIHELLLAISGHSRGSTFVPFAKIKGKWTQISDEIESSHLPLKILSESNKGWHDLETYVPAWGSGGADIWIFTYTWNGKKYIQKSQRAAKLGEGRELNLKSNSHAE